MQASDSLASSTDDPTPERVRAAFREVHGSRLHGFALLLTLGDEPRAARYAARALADGADRTDDLRHPERAAAWLRARVLRHARNARRLPRGRPSVITLGDLGADAAVGAALAVLRVRERAALIASDIERLDQRDVSTIVGDHGAGMDRIIQRARSRYADAFAAISDDAALDGPLRARIRAVADRALR